MKTFKFGESNIFLHRNDLPKSIEKPKSIAIDTETTGLSLKRDRLCLAQFAFPNGECHLVKFDADIIRNGNKSKNIRNIIEDKKLLRSFIMQDLMLQSLINFLVLKLLIFFAPK